MTARAFCDITVVTLDGFQVLKLHSPSAHAILRT